MEIVVKFDMSPQGGGTLRQHYEQAGRFDEIPDLDIPEAADHVWRWFWDLERARSSGVNGAEPLSYREIEAWSRLTGAELRAWEVDALKAMDVVRLRQS